MTDEQIHVSLADAERLVQATSQMVFRARAKDKEKWVRLKRDLNAQINAIKTRFCKPEEHSWRMNGFDFQGNRRSENGTTGIANLMHRVCERCGQTHHQIEISWGTPDSDERWYTIEPWPAEKRVCECGRFTATVGWQHSDFCPLYESRENA